MIRNAKIEEDEILTGISFKSKGYWGYPKEYFNIWTNELTISAEYIRNNDVFVYTNDGVIIGYYSIIELKDDVEISNIKIRKGFWLEHMFIEPCFIGKGIGTILFQHMKERCKKRCIHELGILADPNSKGFYTKMGCEYKSEYLSTIKNRTTPYLLLKL